MTAAKLRLAMAAVLIGFYGKDRILWERRGRFGPALTVRSHEPDNLITSVS